MSIALLNGFGLGISLIAAIGAQNAFVLSQGIKREYYIIIPFICFCCDALLISIGVAGVGSFLMSNSMLTTVATIGGSVFLIVYGIKSFLSIFRRSVMEDSDKEITTLKAVVLTLLALTFLNPHVYIDTILLIGSISTKYEEGERLLFGLGAVTASFVWFFSLSFGGRILSPLFKKPILWKILDGGIALMMWFIAFGLLRTLF